MSNLQPVLAPRGPFTALPAMLGDGRSLAASARDGLGLATVLVRKDRSPALAERMRERFGIELPRGPSRSAAGDIACAGTGPGAWLVTHERDGNAFAASLKEAIGDLAAVSDQSDGFAVLRLSGSKVRETLCKLVPVDMHPRVFRVGDVAVSVAAHVGATLWRLEDRADGLPVFEVAVFRSLATSFWHALHESAAEFSLGETRSEP